MSCAVTFAASTLFYVFVIHAGLLFKGVGMDGAGRIGALIGFVSSGTPLGAALFNVLSRKF